MGLIQSLAQLAPSIRASLLATLSKADHSEGTAVATLRLWLHGGELAKILSAPKITGARFEFRVDGGRIDLLLFHADASVTIIEAKAQIRLNQVAAGIGQLCMYAALLPQALSPHQQPTSVRRVLCAPVEPDQCEALFRACDSAGVMFVPLPTQQAMRSIAERALAAA